MYYQDNFNPIHLNFIKLSLNKEKISVFRREYEKEVFNDLKISLGNKFWFYRGGNYIYAWEIVQNPDGNLENFDFHKVEITLDKDLQIFRKIIETNIFSYFKNLYAELKNRGKIDISDEIKLVRFNAYDSEIEIVMAKELKNEPLKFGDIQLIPILSLSVKGFFSVNFHKPILGITFRKFYKRRFNASPEDLKKRGFNLENFDIKNGKISPKTKNIKEYFENINKRHLYDEILKIEKVVKNSDWNSLYKKLKKEIWRIKFPDDLKIKESKLLNISDKLFLNIELDKPELYFLDGKVGKGRREEALKENKPFSFSDFKEKELKFAVIYPKTYEGEVDIFIKNLRNTLSEIFHLNASPKFIGIDKDTIEDYIDSIEDIDMNNTDLVLIILSENYKNLPVNQSPYYILKAKLLSRGVVSQEANIEKIIEINKVNEKEESTQRNSYLNTISLNIYSKLGGTAWVVQRLDEGSIPELIIGIGMSSDNKDETIYGIANVFDKTGYYVYGDNFLYTYKDNYVEKLKKHLIKITEKAIGNRFKSKLGDKDFKEIRLIFHLYKNPSKKLELKALNLYIEEMKRKYPDVSFDYAFISISQNHSFRLINENNSSTSRLLRLSEDLALLKIKRNNSLLLLKLDNRSTFKDLSLIGRQIHNFSYLGYRSFLPLKRPITVEYPKILAKLLNKLIEIDNWDKDNLNNYLLDKPWFI